VLERLRDALPGAAWLRTFWESVQASYWFVPGIMLLGSVVLAFGMIWIDQTYRPDFLRDFALFYEHEPAGARDVLSTIAGSMITVAGVTFSITIVALQLASTQFGPRLLRNFMRDHSTQVVLGTFVATFLYCLLVLRTVRDFEDATFVPHLSITVALAAAVISICVLIFFIHHLASSLQVSQLLHGVATELERTIDRTYPKRRLHPEGMGRGSARPEGAPEGVFETDAECVRSNRSGYLEAVDSGGIVRLAKAHDVVVSLDRQPGAFVVAGGVIMRVHPAARLDEDLANDLRRAVALGPTRSPVQDPAFLFEELVEVSLRALSSGIDDPTTAEVAIDRIGAALARLASRELPSPYRLDDDGRLRVIAPPLSFPDAVEISLARIRRHGSDDVDVAVRLLEAMRRVAEFLSREGDRRALLDEADRVLESALRHDPIDSDRVLLERQHGLTVEALRAATLEPAAVPGALRHGTAPHEPVGRASGR
jgi:uncharacterized membrane protein